MNSSIAISIKAEDRAKMQWAVQNGLNENDFEVCQELSGTMTGIPVYQIKVKDQFYVIKLENPEDKNFDLKRNYQIVQAVSEQGISPKLYFSDASQGITLTAFIASHPPEASLIRMEKILLLLRRLHENNSFSPWISFLDILNYFYAPLSSDLKQMSLLKNGMDGLRQFQSCLFDPRDLKSCHGDLNPFNILFDGEKYFFIDWQAASPQSFYFDLACFVTWELYPDNVCDSFLNAYFEREATSDEKAKFYLMRIFVQLFYAIIFIAKPVMKASGKEMLASVSLDTLPDLRCFMLSLQSGSKKLDDDLTQMQLGFILLKTVSEMMDHLSYRESFACLMDSNPR